MAKLLKLRRGTTTQHGSFTGAEGEVTIDTTKDTAVVHDGSQAGGRPLAREDMSNVSSDSIVGRIGSGAIGTDRLSAGGLPGNVTVQSANIVDGTIVNADISSSAAIATTKLAAGALPTDVTVSSGNIVNGAINNADMITGAVVGSVNIINNSLLNADINASAAIAGTKIAPNFGSQNIATTGTASTGQITAKSAQEPQLIVQDSDTGNTGNAAETGISFKDGGGTQQSLIGHHNSGDKDLYLDTAGTDHRINFRVGGSTTQLEIENSAVNVTGNITVTGLVDGRDVQSDGGKLDSIEQGATADQTANEILTLLKTVDGGGSGLNADALDSISSGQFVRSDTADTASGTITFNGGGGAAIIAGNSDIRLISGTWSGDYSCKLQHHANIFYIQGGSAGHQFRTSSGSSGLSIDASGNCTAQGNVTAYSDVRLKTDIHTINDALGICGKLRGVSYKWIRDNKPSIGVIAQEVEEVIPEVVLTSHDLNPATGESMEVKSVDYGKIVGVLINAINELKAEVDELKGGK